MRMIKKVINKFLRIIYKSNKKKYVELQYQNNVGFKPNLENPKSFTEKICYEKVNYYNPLYIKCADKYAVRDYVKEKI